MTSWIGTIEEAAEEAKEAGNNELEDALKELCEKERERHCDEDDEDQQ
jgi:hypothetical protein